MRQFPGNKKFAMTAAIFGESVMVQGSGMRVVILRIVGVLVAAGLLAGCDSCGDFLPPIKFQSQVCKQEAPRPQ
jgi:hypothetical protein